MSTVRFVCLCILKKQLVFFGHVYVPMKLLWLFWVTQTVDAIEPNQIGSVLDQTTCWIGVVHFSKNYYHTGRDSSRASQAFRHPSFTQAIYESLEKSPQGTVWLQWKPNLKRLPTLWFLFISHKSFAFRLLKWLPDDQPGATQHAPNTENLGAVYLQFDMTISHFDSSWQEM
jgi:hypothetical protein